MAKILIVDDEPRIRDLIREHLQYAGFVCEEAGDGGAALAVLAQGGIDHRFGEILFFAQRLEDCAVHGVLGYEVDVCAGVALADTVDAGEALRVSGVVECDAVVDTGVGCGQGDAGARRVDLADENHRGGVFLELLDDVAPLLFRDGSVNGHRFHAALSDDVLRPFDDLQDLRDEPGEDHQLLFALQNVVLDDVREGIELPGADQLRLGCIVGDEEAASELLQPQEFGQNPR